MKVVSKLYYYVAMYTLIIRFQIINRSDSVTSMKRSILRTVQGFRPDLNVLSRLHPPQSAVASTEFVKRWSNNKGVRVISTSVRYDFQQRQQQQQRPGTTRLYYYNLRHQQHQYRCMSKITEAKNIERMKNKNKASSNKDTKKEPYEWLPFWTTPERDPNESIYEQSPIAEKDCRPLRLYIPAESDMLEIGTMCAMLFMTTPDLETYASMPNNGDVIFLKGDLGSGKSVFARGFIRGALGNWNTEVPSPTYLLSNTYFASAKKGSNKDLEYVSLAFMYSLCVDVFNF
jgi:Threonylcarbamoyl adenosine biosynthesis protein TsaE